LDNPLGSKLTGNSQNLRSVGKIDNSIPLKQQSSSRLDADDASAAIRIVPTPITGTIGSNGCP